MKNIVFICESYYRGASPNGICVRQVAEELIHQGNTVRVVTLYNDINQPEWETINDVEIHRVDAGFIEKNLYRNKAQQNKTEKLKYQATLKLSRFNGLLHAFRYPLLSERQVDFLYRKSKELYKTCKIDYVVCVYHKIADVLAGIKLKKKYPDIKLILYTLDAISGGWVPNILHNAKIPMNSLKRWEKVFFKHIDKMFAMESHRSYYEVHSEYEKYREKIEYLDIPLLLPKDGTVKLTGNRVRMVYTGSMHYSTANPQYLLKLLPFIKETEVYIYGNVSEEITAIIKAHPLYNQRIFLCGRVAYEKITGIQQEADVLLNFGNGNPNMIPCKIFEYVSTGNKILSFTYSEEDSSLPYIEKYPNGFIVSEDDARIEQNAVRISDFINAPRTSTSKEELCTLFEKNTPAYFCKKLMEV